MATIQKPIDDVDVERFWDLCNEAYSCWQFQQALENHPEKEVLQAGMDAEALARINNILIDWTLLQISKLHDTEKFERKKLIRYNLCVDFFKNPDNWQASIRDDSEFLDEVALLATQLGNLQEHLTEPRNWLLAHNDRDTHRESHVLGASNDGVYEAYFEQLQDFVNLLNNRLSGTGIRPFDDTWSNDITAMFHRLTA